MSGAEWLKRGRTSKADQARDDVIAAILSRTKEKPVQSKALEYAFKLSGAEIRAIVSEARCDGRPLCSGAHGYYGARSPEDLTETKEHIRARLARLHRVLYGLERAERELTGDPDLFAGRL